MKRRRIAQRQLGAATSCSPDRRWTRAGAGAFVGLVVGGIAGTAVALSSSCFMRGLFTGEPESKLCNVLPWFLFLGGTGLGAYLGARAPQCGQGQ